MFKNIIRIIVSILIFIWLNTSIFAIEDDDLTAISNINYTGYLWDESIIKISWTNFNNCSKITINNSVLNTESISDTEITYIFWNNKIYKWSINLRCDWWIAVSAIEFPYIDTANLNNKFWNWEIKIVWWNFISWSRALFEWGGSLIIDSTWTNYFIWVLWK